MRGLGKRGGKREDLSKIASLASFFLSRIDTKIHAKIKSGITDITQKAKLQAVKGKVAIANVKIAYQEYKKIIQSQRWQALADKEANVQRLLWSSTSTKEPKYSDVMYLNQLIGLQTVNTLPPDTIAACADHSDVALR